MENEDEATPRIDSTPELYAVALRDAQRTYGDDARVEKDFSVVPGPAFYARQPEYTAAHGKHIPSQYRALYKRAAAGHKPSAIKAKCLDCCCWQRLEVTLCTTLICPLWKIRPFQETTAEKSARLRAERKAAGLPEPPKPTWLTKKVRS